MLAECVVSSVGQGDHVVYDTRDEQLPVMARHIAAGVSASDDLGAMTWALGDETGGDCVLDRLEVSDGE